MGKILVRNRDVIAPGNRVKARQNALEQVNGRKITREKLDVLKRKMYLQEWNLMAL
jgi:hypothetical protein